MAPNSTVRKPDKKLVVTSCHTLSNPTFAIIHKNDYSAFKSCNSNDQVKFGFLRAPKNRKALVYLIEAKHESFLEGEISLSSRTKTNLQVQDDSTIRVSEIEVGNAAKVHILPITDGDHQSRNWFEDFIKPYLQKFCFDKVPYPVHVDDVLEMTDATGNTMMFIVTEINNKKDGFGLLNPKTKILTEDNFGKHKFNLMLKSTGFADLGGVNNVLDQIKRMIDGPLNNPEIFARIGVEPFRGLLLYGPPGTGKTSIVKAIALELNVNLKIINGPEILASRAGQTEENLRKFFSDCEKAPPSILFLDEIDAIAPKREKASSDLEKRIVSQLLTLMSELKHMDRVFVIAATNRPNEIDPALRQFGRFDNEINIRVPDAKARLEILKIKARGMKISTEVDLSKIAEKCHGYVGADISQLVTHVGEMCYKRYLEEEEKSKYTFSETSLEEFLTVRNEDFTKALEMMTPSALREKTAETPNVSWNEIGGLAEVKQEIQETILFPISQAEKYDYFGITPSRGVLFYGPPGCGKTMLAKAAATNSSVNFISVKGPELLTMWLGESEANVRELFDRARAAAPCILFFDEIDSIAPKRGSGGATDRILNQLLTELDGMDQNKLVFIIGATNRRDCMDPAILRPGRLDQMIYIPPPDLECRLQIFQATLGFDIKTGKQKKVDIIERDVELQQLAEYTNGYSGADIREICSRAVKCAIREHINGTLKTLHLTRTHFESAMKDVRKSISDEELQKYSITRKHDQKENGNTFKFKNFTTFAKENGAQAKHEKDEAEEEDDDEEEDPFAEYTK